MNRKRMIRILLSLSMAGILFGGMMLLEKSQKVPVKKKNAACVIREIPEGMQLDEENIQQYIQVQEIDETYLKERGIENLDLLLGKKARVSMREGTVLQESWFQDLNSIEIQMEEPVRVTLKASDLAQIGGGRFRKGDFLDFYSFHEDTKKATLVFRGLMILEAMDSSGVPVAGNEKEQSVSMITILLEEKDVEDFMEQIFSGSFYLAQCKEYEGVYEKCEKTMEIPKTD